MACFILIFAYFETNQFVSNVRRVLQVIPVVTLPYVFTQRLKFINIHASQSNSFRCFICCVKLIYSTSTRSHVFCINAYL